MKKSVVLCVMTICAMLAMTACGNNTENTQGAYGTKVDDEKLAAYLMDHVTFKDTMSVPGDKLAMELYDLDADEFESITVYASTGATAEEVAVISVKDAVQTAAVRESINDRIEDQKEGFTNYVPGELTKLANPVVTQIGDCIVLVVCDDGAEAENALNDYNN